MKTRAEVLQWLKDKGLYEKVKRKLAIPVEKHPMQDIDLHDFFASAFNWKYTSEGEEYWKKVNREYLAWYGKTQSELSELRIRSRKL